MDCSGKYLVPGKEYDGSAACNLELPQEVPVLGLQYTGRTLFKSGDHSSADHLNSLRTDPDNQDLQVWPPDLNANSGSESKPVSDSI
jgi:hypothetical protein